MFGLPLSLWLGAAGVVLALLAGSHWKAYVGGKDSVRAEWDIDKAERAAAQATADESARLRARAAELGYERGRAAREVRFVTVTKEVDRAIETAPDWASVRLPDGVRDAAAAAGRAIAASEPAGGLRVHPPGAGDERATAEGIRVSPAGVRGLFGPTPSTY
jgi:hypothetical protein